MGTAIRKHLRDFIAIAVLVVAGLVTTYIIVQQQRLRIPVLEERPYELHAEFQTAQAVVPGQGQTIRVAGVRIGDVQDVELQHGVGVVTFAIDREFTPIYKNATILMRPTTGLKDMFFDMDPGTKSAGEIPEGGTVPVENTAPDVNLDEILAALDADSQAYLRLLLVGAGQGLKGRSQELGEVLGSLGPLNRDLDKLNTEVAKRKTALANLVHNLNILTDEIGRHPSDITQFVTASNDALSAIAAQDPDVRRSTAELDDTLATAQTSFQQVDALARQLGPTFGSLRPFARNLDELNASLRELATSATPVLHGQIRPFVRDARPAIPPLKKAATRYSKASPKLTVLGEEINRLGNMAAFNPRGQEDPYGPGNPTPAACGGVDPDLTADCRDEGYLYWAAWLGHNSNSVFTSQDAHGLYRRIYFTLTCGNVTTIINSLSATLAAELAHEGVPVLPQLIKNVTTRVLSFGPLVEAGGPCNP